MTEPASEGETMITATFTGGGNIDGATERIPTVGGGWAPGLVRVIHADRGTAVYGLTRLHARRATYAWRPDGDVAWATVDASAPRLTYRLTRGEA